MLNASNGRFAVMGGQSTFKSGARVNGNGFCACMATTANSAYSGTYSTYTNGQPSSAVSWSYLNGGSLQKYQRVTGNIRYKNI